MRVIVKNGKIAISKSRSNKMGSRMWFEGPIKKQGYINSAELAKIVGVPAYMIKNWAKAGKLEPVAETDGGLFYFTKDHIPKVQMLKEQRERIKNHKGFGRVEFSKIVNVDHSTLCRWERVGLLVPKYKIENRVFYSSSQIQEAMDLKGKQYKRKKNKSDHDDGA